MSGKKGMKHLVVPIEVGEKLLDWERRGIMQQTLEANRYILNFYLAQKKRKNNALSL